MFLSDVMSSTDTCTIGIQKSKNSLRSRVIRESLMKEV